MIVKRLRTFGAVAVLSLLVWVLAESQTLRSESLTLSVSIVSEVDGANLIRVSDGTWADEVELTLEGSAALVSDARDRLGGHVELMVGRELPNDAGDHAVLLRDALRRTGALQGAGVTISEVRPESLTIIIARAMTIETPVRVRAPSGRLDGAPVVSPASVTLRGPAEVISAFDESLLEAVAPIDEALLDGLLPGVGEVIPDIRLEMPEALARTWGVTLSPSTVNVTVQVRTRTRTHTIPRLPVQVVLPPPELGRWRITLASEDTDLFDVAISGPSEGVGQVVSGAARPMAVLSLSFEELERGITSKAAQIVLLPPGVTARVVDAEIGLTIERVEDASADPVSP